MSYDPTEIDANAMPAIRDYIIRIPLEHDSA